MAKKPHKVKPDGIELAPDAWPRFERFIKQVAKAGPQPRTKIVPQKRSKAKKAN